MPANFITNQVKNNLGYIEFDSYEITQDKHLGGYKIKLNWKPNKFAKFYKIYKTSLPKQILDKKFSISQKALEKFTQAQLQQKQTNKNKLL
jgi:hypothetical protein